MKERSEMEIHFLSAKHYPSYMLDMVFWTYQVLNAMDVCMKVRTYLHTSRTSKVIATCCRLTLYSSRYKSS